MNSLGIVYCRHSEEKAAENRSLLSRLFRKSSTLFKKEEYGGWIKKVALDDDISIHLIKIPYSTDELARMSARKVSRIGRFISDYCRKNNAEYVVPDSIAKLQGFQDVSSAAAKGRFLYQALIVPMVDKICSVKGKNIHEFDIVVVHGKDLEELKAVISLLSPHVRYLTVLTDDKEQVERQLSEICDETGLSIRVTGDRKSCFKSADLVINLGSLKRAFSGNRLRSRTLVFNYREPSEIEIAGENIIINGIEVRLPRMITGMLDKNLFCCYSACEVAELILSCKCGCLSSMESVVRNPELMRNISRLFLQDGYIISGFIGKYNTLKIEDIKI